VAILQPFNALRPHTDLAQQVASVPYDVISSEEARLVAQHTPKTFLHVIKPEIDLPPDVYPYEEMVYKKGKDTFTHWIAEGIFIQDSTPSLYIYRLRWENQEQTGIVGLVSVEDYQANKIKIHELTRTEKEEDRVQHMLTTGIHAEPVMLAYPEEHDLDEQVITLQQEAPLYDFVADDHVQHTIWKVSDPSKLEMLRQQFAHFETLYVADGHHRTAAAAKVREILKGQNPHHTGEEPYNFFLAALFPHKQLSIYAYNRVVRDLRGMTPNKFLQMLERNFQIIPQSGTYQPQQPHHIGMYLNKHWYQLIATPNTYYDFDPIDSLDVTVLSKYILEPLLSIKDQRTDDRIDFVGGIKGPEALMDRVDSGEMRIAFNLYPISLDQLMEIADNGQIMPPKTTWFDPKLRSGLLVHAFEQLLQK